MSSCSDRLSDLCAQADLWTKARDGLSGNFDSESKGVLMLSKEDENILRNFDKYVAKKTLKDPKLKSVARQKEGAMGPEFRGKVDKTGLESAFSKDYIFITPDGQRFDRREMVDSLTEGEPAVKFKKSVIESLDSFGNTAWMSGILTLQATRGLQNLSGTYRSSAIFIKRRGQWQQVLLHLSRIESKDRGRPKSGTTKDEY